VSPETSIIALDWLLTGAGLFPDGRRTVSSRPCRPNPGVRWTRYGVVVALPTDCIVTDQRGVARPIDGDDDGTLPDTRVADTPSASIGGWMAALR